MRPVFQSESAMAQTVLLLLLFLWDTLPLTTEVNTCKVSGDDGTSYNPRNKILFTPGETVTVSCGEKMWVKNILEQSAELTCQDNGEWDFHHVCQSVKCFKATDKLSFFDTHPSQRDTYFMNETVLYLCDPEYLETSQTATATCTRRGWEPNPLCQRLSCSIPPLENFVVEEEKTDYKLNEVLRYRCNKNYKKAVLGLTTCMKVGRSAQWSPSPWCEPASCKVSAYPVPGTSYSPRGQNIFKPGENVTVSCGEKMYVKNTELRSAELTCQDDGEWDSYHVCRIVTCDNYDETVQRWENNYTSRQVDESVSYQCRDGYKQTSPTATCTRRGWTPNPLCQVITCKLSADRTDGTLYCPRNKILFTPGETVTVSCGEKMWVKNKLEQSAELTCQDDGEWDFHHVCQNVTCFKATDKIGSFDTLVSQRDTLSMGDTVPYSCIRGYKKTSPIATCTRRGWDPSPLCLDRCSLSLDPNTAGRYLILSNNYKTVTHVEKNQWYPDHQDRFEVWHQILCSSGLTGRCYWETHWRGTVHISVSYRDISRKGGSADSAFGWNDRSWSLECSRDGFSVLHKNKRTSLPHSVSDSGCVSGSDSGTVGVYLDTEAGSLSFYKVSSEGLVHLHTFTSTFTQPLLPGFMIWSSSSVTLLD